MKRILLSLYCSTLLLICQVFLGSTSVLASTQSFYFEDFTADYYLIKTEEGSRLHVKEQLTAIFPDTNQNHGITRSIPYTNMNGKNLTIKDRDALNLTVKRNGADEPINKIEKDTDGGVYTAYIGSSSSYVHGKQVYTLEYDFYNVITEFDSRGENITGQQSDNVAYQELYWDTNGTGWSQSFDNLTARLHLSRDMAENLLDKTSCYVGSYGARGASRCTISSSDETTFDSSSAISFDAFDTENPGDMVITFSTKDLKARENLTFAVDFKPKTFSVPDLPKNWSLVIATIIVIAICGLIIFFTVRKYLRQAKAKRKYYRDLFTAPQYTAPSEYHVAEAEQLALRRTEKSHVATLLELAVTGKIQLIKGEPTKILKKDTWKVKVLDDNVSESQKDLLKILNGGSSFKTGDEIDIKKRSATRSMASLGRSYYSDAVSALKKAGLYESDSTSTSSKSISTILSAAVIAFAICWIMPVIGIVLALSDEIFETAVGEVVGIDYLPAVIGVCILITIIIRIIFGYITNKYKKFTEKGLSAANYLNGLYLYINMAEKDRLKFLQSVKGVDTSDQGIVKLYEKLLPYACLFDLEDSWLKELGKYCEKIDYSLDWYDGDISDITSAYIFSNIMSSVNTSVHSGTTYYESSGSGGGSSFSSGGGGGGFSGGGGGGGGGGGW